MAAPATVRRERKKVIEKKLKTEISIHAINLQFKKYILTTK